jgi:hypothetical protein
MQKRAVPLQRQDLLDTKSYVISAEAHVKNKSSKVFLVLKHSVKCQLAKKWWCMSMQGTLTEGEGSVRLASSLI